MYIVFHGFCGCEQRATSQPSDRICASSPVKDLINGPLVFPAAAAQWSSDPNAMPGSQTLLIFVALVSGVDTQSLLDLLVVELSHVSVIPSCHSHERVFFGRDVET